MLQFLFVQGVGKDAPSRADNVARGFDLGGNLLGLNVDRGVFHFNFVLVSHRFALREFGFALRFGEAVDVILLQNWEKRILIAQLEI